MGEWEELEARLKDLGEEAARLVDDPLDPARVRRIADRRRLRRSVVAVLIAVAILVSGGVGVYAVTSPPQSHTPSPVGDPTSTPTPSPEPSEEASGYGQRIPTATSEPDRGRQPVPPTYPRRTYSPDTTSEPPTSSSDPTPSPTDPSEEPESPEPTSTTTQEPEPPPTSEPTTGGGGPAQGGDEGPAQDADEGPAQGAPPASDPDTTDG